MMHPHLREPVPLFTARGAWTFVVLLFWVLLAAGALASTTVYTLTTFHEVYHAGSP